MLEAMSAEWLKLRRHRATWMLVWIYPIGAFLIPLIIIMAQLLQGSPPNTGTPDLGRWLEQHAAFWNVPPNGTARFLICGYVGVVFAGEYGWNTWKLVVPHRARSSLIAAKFAIVIGLLYLAFAVAAVSLGTLTWLEDVLTGDPIPDGITIGGLLAAHATGLLAGLPTVLFTVALVAFLSVMTRSTTAAIIIGIVIVTLEALFFTFAPMLAMTFGGATELLFHVLPAYHLANFPAWTMDGEGVTTPFPSGTIVAYGQMASLAVALAWTGLLVLLTFLRFGRQDIN